MKSYKCPACKKKQTTVIQWQSVSIAFDYRLSDGDCEEVDRSSNGDHESWTCPECGEDLPINLSHKIREQKFEGRW